MRRETERREGRKKVEGKRRKGGPGRREKGEGGQGRREKGEWGKED